jgi:hypothetical protein|tara:strand:- start:286 stop:624 length:339 start_codon:yes stop_codon:yes gene_type:complete
MSYGGYKKNGSSTANFEGNNIFENIGHPGEYVNVQTVPNGTTHYTGSNYGAAAVIVKTHGSSVFHLSGGGSIPAANLTAGVLYPLSLTKITDASSATIYVLKVASPIDNLAV